MSVYLIKMHDASKRREKEKGSLTLTSGSAHSFIVSEAEVCWTEIVRKMRNR